MNEYFGDRQVFTGYRTAYLYDDEGVQYPFISLSFEGQSEKSLKSNFELYIKRYVDSIPGDVYVRNPPSISKHGKLFSAYARIRVSTKKLIEVLN